MAKKQWPLFEHLGTVSVGNSVLSAVSQIQTDLALSPAEPRIIFQANFLLHSSLLLLWSLQFKLDICWSLLIPHGLKPNYRRKGELHSMLVWTGTNIWKAPLYVYSVHVEGMRASEAWKCQWIQLSVCPKDLLPKHVEKWRGALWLISKGVSMATSPRFPWRHCGLAGSQCRKCIGMGSREEQWHNLFMETDCVRQAHHTVNGCEPPFPQIKQHTHRCWRSYKWSSVLVLISIKPNLMIKLCH